MIESRDWNSVAGILVERDASHEGERDATYAFVTVEIDR